MACYRNGGCGPYEGRSCNECPASKPEYMRRQIIGNHDISHYIPNNEILKIKVFIGKDGVTCALKNNDSPVEIEFIDEEAVRNYIVDSGENQSDAESFIDAHINQLCADGFTYVDEANIVVKNSP